MQNVDSKVYPSDNSKKLDKNALAVGDTVGFTIDDQKIIGKIIRLNLKTVTLITNDNRKWRVSYSLLFSIVDVDKKYKVIDIK